jgi:hypothetical protein
MIETKEHGVQQLLYKYTLARDKFSKMSRLFEYFVAHVYSVLDPTETSCDI